MRCATHPGNAAILFTDTDRHNELVMAYLTQGPLDKRIQNFIQLSRSLLSG